VTNNVRDTSSPPAVIVPVLTLRDSSGRIDAEANAEYAQHAAGTWLDRFILSGSLGGGETATPVERRQIVDIWRAHLPADRLLACAWEPRDFEAISETDVPTMAVMRQLASENEALEALAALPIGSYVYSHPRYSTATYTADLSVAARSAGCLPRGAKVCKVDLGTIAALRDANGPAFELWDGRCRHIDRSVQAGAQGVIAVPLCTLPPLPDREDADSIQRLISNGQAALDTDRNRASRRARLEAERRHWASGKPTISRRAVPPLSRRPLEGR